MIKNILYVCTGNTCRSPMAEYLTRSMLKSSGITDVDVASQGIAGSPILQVPETVVRLMDEQNIDIRSHQPSQVSPERMDWADVVLVMEERQKQVLGIRFPEAKAKIFLFKEYIGEAKEGEINDPIGQSEEGYRQCLTELKKAVFEVVERIKDEQKG